MKQIKFYYFFIPEKLKHRKFQYVSRMEVTRTDPKFPFLVVIAVLLFCRTPLI